MRTANPKHFKISVHNELKFVYVNLFNEFFSNSLNRIGFLKLFLDFSLTNFNSNFHDLIIHCLLIENNTLIYYSV